MRARSLTRSMAAQGHDDGRKTWNVLNVLNEKTKNARAKFYLIVRSVQGNVSTGVHFTFKAFKFKNLTSNTVRTVYTTIVRRATRQTSDVQRAHGVSYKNRNLRKNTTVRHARKPDTGTTVAGAADDYYRHTPLRRGRRVKRGANTDVFNARVVPKPYDNSIYVYVYVCI